MSSVHAALPKSFLVLPPEDDRRFERLRRKVRLLAVRALLTLAPSELPRALGQSTSRLQAFLSSLLAGAEAEKVLDAVGETDVLTPLLLLSRGYGEARDHVLAAVPTLLAGLAARGVTESFVWDQPASRIVDRARRIGLTFDPPATAVVLVGASIELGFAGGARVSWNGEPLPNAAAARMHVCHSALPSVLLSEIDTNPLFMFEAHPDKHGNALSLGGRAASEWAASLSAALDLVRDGIPSWWSELPLSLERIVPVGFDPEKHLSASFQDSPGLAYLSLHPDPLTMAEAIVHETQHGKLNILRWLDPVLANGDSTWTKSPVRPDMRPLSGVLLAAHAFIPVAAMHAQLAANDHPITQSRRFADRRREVFATNAEALATLEEKAEPTEHGRTLLAALRALHDATAAESG